MPKIRDSGMPPEEMWDSFFSPSVVLSRLELTDQCTDIVEFGCGYGTFTIPAARLVRGTVFAFDIDQQMIEATKAKATREKLSNIHVALRDFVEEGTGLRDESVSYAMVFNLLHCERPVSLLQEAFRVLAPGGKLGVIHWRSDIPTPRGPSLDIRPKPLDCQNWAHEAGFTTRCMEAIDIPPYHYGLIFEKRIQGALNT